MLARNITFSSESSFFLLGPRGTGKSTWVKQHFPSAAYIDLLKDSVFSQLAARPERLGTMALGSVDQWLIIDEVQKLPTLLDEVHRLIEDRGRRFVLTGSSARKLKRSGANLLAGRARTLEMHPLTAAELGEKFDLRHSLRFGHLPTVYSKPDPKDYLRSYVGTYLKEEVQQEALVRNIGIFAKFLEAASFSQASVLNIQNVADECGLSRKTAENHFHLLEDLLLGIRLPVFQRRAKRKMAQHCKFYFFDAGVYRSIRPRGPLDPEAEIDGAAIETLVMQELRATNANLSLGYQLSYWRTQDKREVDFILYGELGLIAIEVKRATRWNKDDLAHLQAFLTDYPEATGFLFYGGDQEYKLDRIRIIPLAHALLELPRLLGAPYNVDAGVKSSVFAG
jgi:uncharacterized protein